MNSKIFLSLERHCWVEDLKLKSNLKNNQKRLSWTIFFEFLSYIEKTFNLLPTHFFYSKNIHGMSQRGKFCLGKVRNPLGVCPQRKLP